MKDKTLETKGKSMLMFICSFIDIYGYPPSIRDIAADNYISSTSVVNYYLDALSENEYIKRDKRVARGIVVTRKGKKWLKSNAVTRDARTR